jgi:hypothetical protein
MTGVLGVRSAAILFVALISASCGPAPPQVLTVKEVVPRIDELNGQTVDVSGYLSACRGYECVLYRTKQDADEWKRAIAAVSKSKRPLPLPDPPALAIGSGTNFEFDAKAASFTNSYVVITGRITNECRFEGKPACTDRGPDLKPTAIRAASPPAHGSGER